MHCNSPLNVITCTRNLNHRNMLSSLLVSEVTTTQFYYTYDHVGFILSRVFIVLLAAGVLFATVKYVRR